ncbi:MAG: hypothetical protein RLY31_2634 [Bacteroidota bacterium]|jgi:LysM repeat protein
MKRYLTVILLLFWVPGLLPAQQSVLQLDYIERYKRLAMQEMERAGVPASIKMAQALLESNAGQSELARKANNHFGIKCGGDWTGKTYHHQDDDTDAYGNPINSCFRKFPNVEESWVAHSEFLRNPRSAHRYGPLFELNPLDYKAWAKGLVKASYATDRRYADKLIDLIERYELDQLDRMAGLPGSIRPALALAGLRLQSVNDIKVIVADSGLTVDLISTKADIPLRRLARYNEWLPHPSDPLPADYRVFLQPKRSRYRGPKKWHHIQEGETLLAVSQQYGVKLSALQRRNRIGKNERPKADQRVKLKGFRVSADNKPLVVPADPALLPEPAPWPADTPPGTVQPAAPIEKPDLRPEAVFHTVAKGDTLFSIARRYGTTVELIVRTNALESTLIRPGQVLRIK